MCIARLTMKQFCVPLPTGYIMYFVRISRTVGGPGSAVGVATGYGLEGPEIESR